MMNRRQFLKICASSLIAVSCSQSWSMLPGSAAANRQIPVLLYHRVGYTSGHLTVTPERFANDLRLLNDYGFLTISLQQFKNYILNRNAELPENPVLITFDDGYLDNYENAYPLLQRYGMTAAFFVITSLLWDKDRLSPERIREMAQAGMSFGSHTVSHRPLGKLSTAEANEELNSSRSTLESILGISVQTVAYPQGSYNAATVKTAADNGYTGGFTTIRGTCSRQSQLFELSRIPVFNYDNNIISIMANNGVWL